jgi:hypothetical protein
MRYICPNNLKTKKEYESEAYNHFVFNYLSVVCVNSSLFVTYVSPRQTPLISHFLQNEKQTQNKTDNVILVLSGVSHFSFRKGDEKTNIKKKFGLLNGRHIVGAMRCRERTVWGPHKHWDWDWDWDRRFKTH